MARQEPEAAIVELGSYKGKSTVALAAGVRSVGPGSVVVYAVDTFEGSAELAHLGLNTFADFQSNIARSGLTSLVQPIQGLTVPSAGLVERPISLLFIDADHSYEGVRADFEAWAPMVIPNGIIAFHDTFGDWEGPNRFVHERIYGRYASTGRIASLTWCRNAPATVMDRVRGWTTDTLALRGLKQRLPQPLKAIARGVLARH
jgi:hypothetical protein